MLNRFNRIVVKFLIIIFFLGQDVLSMTSGVQLSQIEVITDLPAEVIEIILDNLGNKKLCEISIVCKTFAVHVKEIKRHRQLGVFEDGVLVLRDQEIVLPLDSDRVFFNQCSTSFPILFDGVVIIKCVEHYGYSFSLKSPCVIKSTGTLNITDGTILELAPSDGRLEPLVVEVGSAGLVISNATLKTKSSNPEGVFLNTKLLTFQGKCFLDASDGRLKLIEGMSLEPNATVTIKGIVEVMENQ